jgi:DNA invertase Pin-like site-specific DNA recombinase
MPVKEHILVFSTESDVSTEDIINKVSQYIKSVEYDLSLHPPSNITNREKKETLRNLYESGISEEMIANQLDLDVKTVRMILRKKQILFDIIFFSL